jgi:hypothetical protein
MKAQVAKITINGESVLKVSLMPEDEKEVVFLKDALETCGSYDLSASFEMEDA